MLRERKGNAKRKLEIKCSVLRGTHSWEDILEAHKIQWNAAKHDALKWCMIIHTLREKNYRKKNNSNRL